MTKVAGFIVLHDQECLGIIGVEIQGVGRQTVTVHELGDGLQLRELWVSILHRVAKFDTGLEIAFELDSILLVGFFQWVNCVDDLLDLLHKPNSHVLPFPVKGHFADALVQSHLQHWLFLAQGNIRMQLRRPIVRQAVSELQVLDGYRREDSVLLVFLEQRSEEVDQWVVGVADREVFECTRHLYFGLIL